MNPSSNIKKIKYDAEKKELIVHFHSGGVYRYPDVSLEDFKAFDSAESPGKHFHKHFRERKATKL